MGSVVERQLRTRKALRNSVHLCEIWVGRESHPERVRGARRASTCVEIQEALPGVVNQVAKTWEE